jgi:NADPH2:quinone reductase
MKAIQIFEVGGPDKMKLVELDLPDPGPGQVRIRIEATGVNFIDTYFRTGIYPAALPFTPGMEAAGVVDQVGEGTEGFAPGDRVAWTGLPGAYASHCLAPAARLVRIPKALSTELAAASLLQGMTAHYLTHGVRDTRPGDTALVHAAAGGTGGLLVQMLKQAGARVIATCGTKEKAVLAGESGADEVILYTKEDFQSRTRELTDGRGVDVVYDSVGQSTFEGSLGSLRPRGLLCLFGQASGPVPPFDLGRLNGAGSLFVTRPSLAHYIADRESLELRSGAVYGALAKGTLVQRIGGRYALADAAKAHSDLEGRGTVGKLLIVPDES